MSCNCNKPCNCVDPCSDTQIRRIVDDAVADRIEDMEDIASSAQGSATASENSADQSAQSAAQSQQFATTAGNNATSAAQSAQQAAVSATAAAESATAAVQVTTGLKQVADELTNTANNLSDKVDNANHNAELAETARDEAVEAATTATSASGIASTAATSASSSAATASTAADTATSASISSTANASAAAASAESAIAAATTAGNAASTATDAQTAAETASAAAVDAANSAADSKDAAAISATEASDAAAQAIALAIASQTGVTTYANEAAIHAASPSQNQIAQAADTMLLYFWDGSTWAALGITLEDWVKDIGNLDSALTSASESWTDRNGVTKKTWTALEDAVAHMEPMVTYSITSSDPDGTIAGLAGTSEGGFFRVIYTLEDSNLIIYRVYKKVGGLAVFQNYTPSIGYVDRLASDISNGGMLQYDGDISEILPLYVDSDLRVIGGYNKTTKAFFFYGMESLTSLEVTDLSTDATKAFLGKEENYGYGGADKIYPVITDANFRVLLGWDGNTNQLIGANGSSPSNTLGVAELKDINHLLAYGQSLSVGAVGTPVISTIQPYNNVTFKGGPRAAGADFSSLIPLVEDTRTAPDGGTNRGETSCSGMANYTSVLANKMYGLTPANFIMLASTAGKGGTAIANLVKGTTWYETKFLPHISGGKAQATALNKSYAVQAIPWIQGETDNDAGTPTTFAVYRAALEQLQEDMQADVKAVTGQSGNVPVLTMQTNYKIRVSDGVALAQLDLAQKKPNFILVGPNYHLPHASDSTHLTAVGYKWQGAMLAKAFTYGVLEKILANAWGIPVDNTPTWINPVSAVIKGNVITVNFDNRYDLEFSTSKYPEVVNYGFVVKDFNGQVAITSLVTEGKTVVITLANAPTGSVEVRYALDNTALSNIVSGAAGNLFDTDPTSVMISGNSYSLSNACPAFKLTAMTEDF